MLVRDIIDQETDDRGGERVIAQAKGQVRKKDINLKLIGKYLTNNSYYIYKYTIRINNYDRKSFRSWLRASLAFNQLIRKHKLEKNVYES